VIKLTNLSKAFWFKGENKIIADNISTVFPSGVAVGLLGRNGAGKSSLLRMIAGTLLPDSGKVEYTGRMSWPIGFAGSFHPDLSGGQNTRFIARVYGVDTNELIDFVESFAELGGHFAQPVRTYSAGMRARLAFGVAMGISFDTYLVDEVTSVGDAAFKQKSQAVFKARMQEAGAIVVTHSPEMMRQMCQAGAILERGVLTYYEDLEEAISRHTKLMTE
jgi:capsular polysaccharide transport system ATP-binding protein